MTIRNLVTGGAGFLGSHLIDKLILKNEEVVCLDNYFTGRKTNIIHLKENPKFELIRHDVTEPILLEVDKIWHLACPASPIYYQKNPIKTTKTSFMGTYNMLGLAKRIGAKILIASTSEIYGDPEVHPQKENYNGNVNTYGIRACYDEGKRIAETLCFDFQRVHSVDARIARIFNTYGPRMLPEDGRVVSNFIVQSLRGQPLTIYGEGQQTRSFCFVEDLIEGLIKLMESDYSYPINIGNPQEYKIIELADLVRKEINPNLQIIKKTMPKDDPKQRKPDIELAKKQLNWFPKTALNDGLKLTIDYFRRILN